MVLVTGVKRAIKIIWRMISNEKIRFSYMTHLGIYNLWSDEKYLSEKYRKTISKNDNILLPSTFNAKLQWLKLYDRKPQYTIMVDKYKVREYIKEKIGEDYLIPLLGVWDSPNSVDFDALPSKFVIKCNHNSGLGMCICKDKSKLDIKNVKKGLEKGLKQDYYLTGREWPYKNVPRKIVAEQFLENGKEGLTDYKIHCFNGIPKCILVCRDRFSEEGLTEDFFTTEWERMDVKRPNIPNSIVNIPKPEKLDEMLILAQKLSENIPFLRVDFYFVEGRVYFSELTFFPASGFTPFEPPEWDKTFGDWLELPNIDK